MHRKKIIGLTQTILQVFEENQTRTVESKEIYAEVKKRLRLTPEQMELAYYRPKFHHSIRSTLCKLVNSDKIVRISKGEYRKALPNDKLKGLLLA